MSARWVLRVLPLLVLGQLTGCAVSNDVSTLNVNAFGAIGDGKTKATASIQQALDRCAADGGGEVVIPAGNYLIGSLQMGANTTLRLSEGATLIGSPDPADYPILPIRFEGETVPGHRALIYASHADHVSILGPGCLQGDSAIGDLRRPRAPVMIELENCNDVHLENFKDRYRRMWSIHLMMCHDVLVKNLNIRTTRTNGDGIDVDSSTSVHIDHCDIDTGDDAISLKSGRGGLAMRQAKPTSDVLITDCTLGSNFAGVGIGTELSGGISNVKIQRCTFTRGDNAIFLKSRLGRAGYIENLEATDLDTSSKTCLGINLVNKGIVGTEPIMGTDGMTVLKNVKLNRITIHAGILLDGSNVPVEKPIEGLEFTDVNGNCKKGISLANVKDARLANIHISGFEGPMLETKNVIGTGLEGAVPPDTSGVQQLQTLFENPLDDARPMVRWWWFGPAVTQPELKREIQAMKSGGFGGFEVQPSYPLAVDGEPQGLKNIKFLSDEFLGDLNYVATIAKDAGMRFDLTLGSGWPYGGSMITPSQAAGKLRVVKVSASAGQSTVDCPKLREGETVMAAFAGNNQLTLKDDQAQLPGNFDSTVPVSFYISGRTGMKVKRPTLGAEGYVLDHENLAAVTKFIDLVGNKEIEACGTNPPYSVFCDSLESYGEDWTENLLSEFQKRRGYDLKPLLPALTGDMGAKTMEIRHDWGQTLTEVFNDCFVKPMRSLAEDHKIRFRIQAYGVPSAGLFSYADADLPEGEGFQWHGYRATRYASSASHLMGLPVTSSETFTWLHGVPFRATPLDIKAEADLHFLQGVNQLICHGWPYTPPDIAPPGWSFYVGAVFDDKNPWYGVMPDVTRYLTRVSTMLRQGRPANDVALYLANDDAWANFTPAHVSLSDGVGAQLGKQIVGDILDAGYNLDFFDDQMLNRFGRLDGGGIVFNQLRYKVVVLAGVERIPLATMKLLENLARAGGVVVATRREPALAPGYLASDSDSREIQAICKRLFHDPGAPGIFLPDESSFATALANRLAPDALMSPAAPELGVVHRHTDFAEVYFVANTSNKPVTTKATFRIEGSIPQIWDPMTGTVGPIAIADHPPGGTSINLKLEPYQSTFIVWTGRTPASTKSTRDVMAILPIDLSADWKVQFGPDDKPTTLPALQSWTDDPAHAAFSGTCSYTRTLKLTPEWTENGAAVWLNFGTAKPIATPTNGKPGNSFQADLEPPVREAAVVYINNHRVGSVWCPPYRLNVTKWLTPSENQIRIDVSNTAVNQLANGKFPNYDVKAISRQFGERFSPPKSQQYQPVTSGLLGPLQLQIEN